MRVFFLVCSFLGATLANGDDSVSVYDPLAVHAESSGETIDSVVRDSNRSRDIPIKVYLPAEKEAAPVLLFSHGLGGSREACSYLGKHWSARGYVAVFLQHAGSDESVWQNVTLRERLSAMKRAANGKNALARYQDVPAVLDQLQKWNESSGHALFERCDFDKVGMSGHSFGSVTTAAVSGQSYSRQGQRFTDPRIDAAVLFSPNRPQQIKPEDAFGDVSIPWMLMTGTKDVSRINNTTVEDRRSVYPALPKEIHKYELVLHDAEHSAFSDERRGFRNRRNPNHHRVILALSTAFWDANLKSDAAASKWLHGESAKSVVEPKDQWQLNLPAKTEASDSGS
ncbi:MAG: dienelactone hydrolase [Planctomycetota bacterium]